MVCTVVWLGDLHCGVVEGEIEVERLHKRALLKFDGRVVHLVREEHRMQVTEDTLLIDVRTPLEFAQGHIAGSLNIPHEQIEDIAEAIGERKDRPVILFCRSGARSGMALGLLMQQGYTQLANGGGVTDLAARMGVSLQT